MHTKNAGEPDGKRPVPLQLVFKRPEKCRQNGFRKENGLNFEKREKNIFPPFSGREERPVHKHA